MVQVDRSVAKRLNDLHQQRNDTANQHRDFFREYKPGDEVYYRRPERSGNKLDSRWLGPAIVLDREGESSYLFQLGEGTKIDAH